MSKCVSRIDKKLELKERIEDRDDTTSNWLELAENFWADYDNRLFERLENTRRRIFLQLYLPRLRPVITEALAGLLVLFVLLAMIEKGLGYDLKTYLYLLKQVW